MKSKLTIQAAAMFTAALLITPGLAVETNAPGKVATPPAAKQIRPEEPLTNRVWSRRF